MKKSDVSVANACALYRELLDAKGPRARNLTNRIVHLLDGFDERQTNAYYKQQRAILTAWNPHPAAIIVVQVPKRKATKTGRK